MHLPRLLFAFGLAALLGIGTATRPSLAADDAADFIANTGDQVLKLARDETLAQADFKQRLRAIAEQDFDTPRIAQFVLGRYWRTASDADRQQFAQAFEDYMVRVYATRFREYGGVSFKVVGQRQEGNATMVNTEIGRPNGQPPAKMIWQIAKMPNGYKITDVSIEGVSQALTYREEFSTVLQQHSGQVSALTQSLRLKAGG